MSKCLQAGCSSCHSANNIQTLKESYFDIRFRTFFQLSYLQPFETETVVSKTVISVLNGCSIGRNAVYVLLTHPVQNAVLKWKRTFYFSLQMLQPVAELCLQLFHFERATHVARKSTDYRGTKSYIILFYISQRKRTVNVYGSLYVCNCKSRGPWNFMGQDSRDHRIIVARSRRLSQPRVVAFYGRAESRHLKVDTVSDWATDEGREFHSGIVLCTKDFWYSVVCVRGLFIFICFNEICRICCVNTHT